MIYPIGGCSTHPIIHVAVAVADTDETYGAYAAAEDDTFNNTGNNDNHANHRNDDDLDEIQSESMKFNENH